MDREVVIRMVTTGGMPDTVSGCCRLKDGKYLILINENKSADEQTAAAVHEFLHIWHDDHNSGRRSGLLERERH